MILSQQLSTVASKNLAKAALVYLEKDITYNDLRSKVGRLSYLYQRELGQNPRVAFLTSNSPAVVATFFALTNIRAVSIPMDPDRPPEDLAEWLKGSKATHLAVTSDLVGKGRELLQFARLNLPIIEIEKKQGGEFDTSYKPPADKSPADKDNVLLLRTGGTSGKPKFVMFNHLQVYHAAVCLRGVYQLSAVDRILTSMNWAHPFAWFHGMLFPLLNGATCVVNHGLQNQEFLDFILKSRVTRLIGTPPQVRQWALGCRDRDVKLPGIKSITVGLGHLDESICRTLEEWKVPVMPSYGQTEVGWTISLAGRGLAGLKYKVLDDQGYEITGRDTREGPLAVMGPCAMTGYLGLEKESKNVLRGTWVYTGDLARLEGDGEDLQITFLGRREDVLEHKGERTFPDPIDKALKGIPGLEDGGAFPYKTAMGEPMMACAVVKSPGVAVTEKQILDEVAARLKGGQVPPKVLVFTDFIPRDAGGNVNRFRLRVQFSGIAG